MAMNIRTTDAHGDRKTNTLPPRRRPRPPRITPRFENHCPSLAPHPNRTIPGTIPPPPQTHSTPSAAINAAVAPPSIYIPVPPHPSHTPPRDTPHPPSAPPAAACTRLPTNRPPNRQPHPPAHQKPRLRLLFPPLHRLDRSPTPGHFLKHLPRHSANRHPHPLHSAKDRLPCSEALPQTQIVTPVPLSVLRQCGHFHVSLVPPTRPPRPTPESPQKNPPRPPPAHPPSPAPQSAEPSPRIPHPESQWTRWTRRSRCTHHLAFQEFPPPHNSPPETPDRGQTPSDAAAHHQ